MARSRTANLLIVAAVLCKARMTLGEGKLPAIARTDDGGLLLRVKEGSGVHIQESGKEPVSLSDLAGDLPDGIAALPDDVERVRKDVDDMSCDLKDLLGGTHSSGAFMVSSPAVVVPANGCGTEQTPCAPYYSDAYDAGGNLVERDESSDEKDDICIYTRIFGPVFFDELGIYTCEFEFVSGDIVSTPTKIVRVGSAADKTAKACCPEPVQSIAETTSSKWSAVVRLREGPTVIKSVNANNEAVSEADAKVWFEVHGPNLDGFDVTGEVTLKDGSHTFLIDDPDTPLATLEVAVEDLAAGSSPLASLSIERDGASATCYLKAVFEESTDAEFAMVMLTVKETDGATKFVKRKLKILNGPSCSADTPCLLIKLDTNDGHKVYYDSDFWATKEGYNEGNLETDPGDIKTAAYWDLPVQNQIQIWAHENNGALIAKSFWPISSAAKGMTLWQILNDVNQNGVDFVFTDARLQTEPANYKMAALVGKSNGNGNAAVGDMFFDFGAGKKLIANRKRAHGAAEGTMTRISNNYDLNNGGCHRYNGFGGYHTCNDWSFFFEANPHVGYCGTYQQYGTDYEGQSGKNNPMSSCGQTVTVSHIDWTIWGW